MINILLLILIVNQIFHIIVKPQITTLNCGIWGFFGNINKFDLNKFNILGINNEDRGGDAIGVVTEESVIHTTNYPNYTDFIAENKLKHPSKKINYVAGHVRKASDYVTRKFEEYAQPMINWNDDFKEINHIMSHNGTLLAYDKLFDLHLKDIGVAKFSYLDINTGDITSHSNHDSQVLFQALIYKKYEVLRDYAGTAAFAFYDVKTRELYLYSGESESMSSTAITNERPLYYLQEKDYIWYSSIKKGLTIIGDKVNVKAVTPNTMMVFKDGVLIRTIDVDRSNSGQSIFKTKALRTISNVTNNYVENLNKKYFGANNYSGGHTPLAITLTSNANDIFGEVLNCSTFCVEYVNSRYYHKGDLMNGIYHLTERGLVCLLADYTTKFYKGITNPYYFIDGVMLTNHEAYNECCRLIKSNSYKQGDIDYFKLILKHSVYPISNIHDDITIFKSIFYENTAIDNLSVKFRFTGKTQPLFSSREYFFIKGILNNTIKHTTEKDADHSKNKKPNKNVFISRTCGECGCILSEVEEDYCDFCYDVKINAPINNTHNKGSEMGVPWLEDQAEDDSDVIDLTEDDDFSEDDLKAELNGIDTAIAELKYKLLGADNPFYKRTKEVCEEIQEALTQLENWSWENSSY